MSKARNLSKVDVSSNVDVTANSFIGDGSQLTGIVGSGGGASAIDDLTDVDTSTVAPSNGQTLSWDGSNWIPTTLANTPSAIDDLTDVDTSTVAPTTGQSLTWDGSNWIPTTLDYLSTSGGEVTGNVQITGDLTVLGTTTTVSAQELSVTDNLIYLNGDIMNDVTNIVADGSTLVITTALPNGRVVGDSIELYDFDPVSYNTEYVVTAVNSTTQFVVSSSNVDTIVTYGYAEYHTHQDVDLGMIGSYDDGTYAHAGFFRDATDRTWKFFDGYVPEFNVDVDTSEATFTLSPIMASDATFTGSATATSFIGDGSQLTNLPAGDATTLDGLDSTQFLRSDADDTMYGNLTVSANRGSAWNKVMTTLVTNLGNAEAAQFTFGKAKSYANSTEMNHHHISDGNSSNYMTIGGYAGGGRLGMRYGDGHISMGPNAWNAQDFTEVLNVNGNVKATAFIGDGSQLTGISGGGASTLSDLTDVSTASPSSGQALAWSGSQWEPTTISSGSATLQGTAVGNINMDHYTIHNAVMNPCPEGKLSAAPYLVNDFGYNRKRGGAVVSITNATIADYEFDNMFDPKASYWSFNNTATDESGAVVLEFTLAQTLVYAAYVGIAFGASWNRAGGIRLEAFSEGAWVDVINTNTTGTNYEEVLVAKINGNAGTGTSKLRVSLWGPAAGDGTIRVAHIFGYDFNSELATTYFLPKEGGEIYGDLNVQGALTINGSAIQPGASSWWTGDTGGTANQYYHIGRIITTSQYRHNKVAMYAMQNTGSNQLSAMEVRFAVSQYSAMGNAPSVSLQVDAKESTQKMEFGYVVTVTGTESIVDLYVLSTATYARCSGTVLSYKMSSPDQDTMEWYGDSYMTGTTTAPAGIVMATTQGLPAIYSEGQFTPVINVGTVSTAAGRWSRVGNQVTVQFLIKGFSDATSWSNIQINNMPFSGMNEELTSVGTCSWHYINPGTGNTSITCVMGQYNDNKLYFKRQNTAGGAESALQHWYIDDTNAANAFIRGTITYLTNDA